MTKMSEARQRALQHILSSFEPPPRMTTPRASRERIRKAVEQTLKSRDWELHGHLLEVQEVTLDIVNGQRTIKVYAIGKTNDKLALVMTLDEWMDNVT